MSFRGNKVREGIPPGEEKKIRVRERERERERESEQKSERVSEKLKRMVIKIKVY